jgi:hypothetical protein
MSSFVPQGDRSCGTREVNKSTRIWHVLLGGSLVCVGVVLGVEALRSGPIGGSPAAGPKHKPPAASPHAPAARHPRGHKDIIIDGAVPSSLTHGRAVAGEPAPSVGLRAEDARTSLERGLESALGSRVHVRWERARPLVPRRLGFEAAAPRPGTPESVAGALLERILAVLGDETAVVVSAPASPAPTGRSLVVSGALETRSGVLVDAAAYVDGLPVADGALRTELRSTTAGLVPVSVVGRFHPGVTLEGTFAPAVEDAARASAPAVVRPGFRAEVELRRVAFETAPGLCRRALELTVPEPLGARRDFLDAETGAVLASFPLACSGTAQVETWERDPRGRRAVEALPELSVEQGRKRAVTDADGRDRLMGTVELSRGFDGPLVRVWPDDGEAPLTYSGPADFTLLDGRGDEASVHQDEASAFTYAVTYNAYMQETYPEIARAAKVRYAIVVASDFENAFFAPEKISSDDGESFPGYVDLGIISGRSCARDATVVKHEYTHALLNGCAVLYGNDEALGVNEGLADYFPCTFYEHPRVGEWLTPPYVRALDDKPRKLVYPDDQDGDPHRTGNIFNQALWDARKKAEARARGGRLEVDQAVFAGVLRMPEGPSLADARDAILAADEAVNGGAHGSELAEAFLAHGISGSDEGPSASAPDSGDVTFTEPTQASFVVHTDETLEVPVEATSASGAKVTLSASKLANGKLTRHGGSTATGTFRFSPDESQRGRQTVTFTATSDAGSASASITILVRKRSGS